MSIVAFDTETRGLDWWNPEHRAFLITWADARGEHCTPTDDAEGVERFKRACKNAKILVAHNFSFDAHQVREAINFDVLGCSGTEFWDTDIMARVVYPMGQEGGPANYKLKNLAKVFLREDAGDTEDEIVKMAKAIGLKTIRQTGAYYEVWRAYPQKMEAYALNDARITYDLFEKLLVKVCGDRRAQKIMALENAVMPILIHAEQRGVALDPGRVKELTKDEKAKLVAARDQLVAEGIPTDGEGVEDKLIEALQMHGVPLHRRTRTGKLSTSKFALQEFEDDYPVIKTLQDWRAAEKLLSTYLGPMDGRGTVHPSFRQCEAWTGRMSCARPNMQNLPRGELRSVLTPREGYAFVVADYDAIEVRLLAWYTGSDDYRRRVDLEDPHAWMASEIAASPGAPSDWPATVHPDDYAKGGKLASWRDKAKNGLFAISYGAGGGRLTDMFKLDPGPPLTATSWEVRNGIKEVGEPSYAPGKALARAIKNSVPGYHTLNKRIRAKIESVGHVHTIMGRRQPVTRDKAYVGLNALIQGSAADIMKQGLINVHDGLADFDAHILLVVHDEVVVEVRQDEVERAEAVIVNAMEAAYELTPPLKVTSAVVSTNYADAK